MYAQCKHRKRAYTWECRACPHKDVQRPGESVTEFNERVFDTHVIYHLAFGRGVPKHVPDRRQDALIGKLLSTIQAERGAIYDD